MLVAIWTAPLCPQSAPSTATSQIDSAHFTPAIRAQLTHAERQTRERPRDARAAGALAMTLHAYQQYAAAARAYSRALLLDPRNFDWLYLLGAVQMELGKFDSAAKSFASALELRPDDLAAELRLAQSLTTLARWDEVGALYRRVLDRHPGCPQAWYGLGRVQSAQNDHAGAAESFAKACELFPLYGAAHFALAAEQRRLDRKADAAAHIAEYAKNVTAEPPLDDPPFKRVYELNQSARVHLQRGTELEKAGRLEESVREHEVALAVDPANMQAHINLISLYARTGNPKNAKEHFEAATRINPGRSDAWYNYGVLLFQQQDFSAAEQAFRRAVAINPYYAEAHTNLGMIYQQQSRLDDAVAEFREAIANQPDYPLPRFQLGRILVNQQKYGEAIQQFRRALSPEDDKTPAYLYALAATYARAGDRRHALEYFEKARDAARARGQSQLLTSIDRDLKTLGREQ
jgi:tetratricopeptide (TPR) repeat protein